MQALTIKSPAKINLFLKVIRKRSDGYHEICTVFQMINLCDLITITPDDKGIKISSNNKDIPSDTKNLAFKAAELFIKYCGLKRGVTIYIDKKIPVAAGLGGGSSNAAFTLLGLNKMWNTGLTDEELFDIAKSIGADVPFFLKGPTAYGEGTGDILTPVKTYRKIPVMLVNPNIAVSAKWAYTKLGLTKSLDTGTIKDYLSNLKNGLILDKLAVNDLEIPVIRKYPIIYEIKQELKLTGARYALMSGSGSTVFGIFDSLEEVKSAYKILNRSKWSVFITETITDLLEFEIFR